MMMRMIIAAVCMAAFSFLMANCATSAGDGMAAWYAIMSGLGGVGFLVSIVSAIVAFAEDF